MKDVQKRPLLLQTFEPASDKRGIPELGHACCSSICRALEFMGGGLFLEESGSPATKHVLYFL